MFAGEKTGLVFLPASARNLIREGREVSGSFLTGQRTVEPPCLGAGKKAIGPLGLPSPRLTWKLPQPRWKTVFYLRKPSGSFHVSLRECKLPADDG